MTKSSSKVFNPNTGKKLLKNTPEGKMINNYILACNACPDTKILFYKTGKCTSKRDPRVTQDSNSRELLKFCEKYANDNISSIDARFLDNFLDIKIPKRIVGSGIKIKDLVNDKFKLGIKLKEASTKKNQLVITAIISSIVSSLIFFPKMRNFILDSLKKLFIDWNVGAIAITGFTTLLKFMTKDYFSEKAIDLMIERLVKKTPADSEGNFFTPKTKTYTPYDGSRVAERILKRMIDKDLIDPLRGINLEKLGLNVAELNNNKVNVLKQNDEDGSVSIIVNRAANFINKNVAPSSVLNITIFPLPSEQEIKTTLTKSRDRLFSEIRQEYENVNKLIIASETKYKNKKNLVEREDLEELIKQLEVKISKLSRNDEKLEPYKKQLRDEKKQLSKIPIVRGSPDKETITTTKLHSEYSLQLAEYLKNLERVKTDINNSDSSNYLYNGAISKENIGLIKKAFSSLRKP